MASAVFSLGMLMFELLSLERPYFDAVNRFEANEKVMAGVRPTFPKACPGFNERFLATVFLFSLLKITSN